MNKVIDTDRATITVNGKRINANKFTDISKYTDVYFGTSKRVAKKIKRKANWEEMKKKHMNPNGHALTILKENIKEIEHIRGVIRNENKSK